MSVKIRKLCERLLIYADNAKDPASKKNAIENCKNEIQIAEILISAKAKTTPLSTHLMFQMALRRQLPDKVKKLMEGKNE